MWIFTKYGFFSAVCARQGSGKQGQPVDADRIMVRGRVRSHLEALKKRFPDLLGEYDIQDAAGTDYAYRLFIQKSAWMQVVSGLAEETDYDNFKSEVAHTRGHDFAHALLGVWSTMHDVEDTDARAR